MSHDHPSPTAASQRLEAFASFSSSSHDHKSRSRSASRFSTLLLAVFFSALLMALTCGVNVYRKVSDIQTANGSMREGLELIQNLVRSNDANESIAFGEGPEGRSLVIVQHLDSGTYETRVYLYEGHIVQEYSLAGSAYTPDKASVICTSDTFSFSYKAGLLSVSTDQGTAEIALRSLQGGA